MLERRGIISGYEGSKPRRVLIGEAELQRATWPNDLFGLAAGLTALPRGVSSMHGVGNGIASRCPDPGP